MGRESRVFLTNDVAEEAEPSQKGPCDKRSSADVICLLLQIPFCVGCAAIVLYAFFKGNPDQLLYPSNSEGELCGHGKQAGKPHLLYFDLTQCAGISAVAGGCSTPQVCVKECPKTYWTSAQGKSPDLYQFCDNLSPGNNTAISQLVKEKSCPAYLLPSKPVLGRCVPMFGLVKREDTKRAEAKMNAIKTADGQALNADSLIEGIKYVMDSVDNRGHVEKLLSCLPVSWWIVLLAYLLALVFSITLAVLIQLAARPVLWTSTVLCLAILVAGTVSLVIRYSQLGTDRDDIYFTTIITNMSSYWYNKITWLVCIVILGLITIVSYLFVGLHFQKIDSATKLIKEVSGAVGWLVFFIPIGQSMIQLLVICLYVTIASFLVTVGSPEFRVVDACSSETVTNNDTGKMFSLHDVCNPQTFAESTGCPRAQCVFHKFAPASLGFWLQVWNLIGMVCLVWLVQYVGCLMMSAAVASMAGDLPSVGVWASFKRTCRGLGTLTCGSLLPFLDCQQNFSRIGYLFTSGDRFCGTENKPFKLLSRNLEERVVLIMATHFIILLAKLFILGLVAAASFAIFSTQVTSSLDIYLNYQFGLILVIILGVYFITSCFLDTYSIAINTLVNCSDEDMEDSGGRRESIHIIISNLKRILKIEDKKISNENPIDANENISQRIELHEARRNIYPTLI